MAQNPMHFVTVSDLQVLSLRTVVFIISLKSHRHLRDAVLVQASLDAYMHAYPNVESWQAEARDGWLYIKVTGDINPEAYAKYSR